MPILISLEWASLGRPKFRQTFPTSLVYSGLVGEDAIPHGLDDLVIPLPIPLAEGGDVRHVSPLAEHEVVQRSRFVSHSSALFSPPPSYKSKPIWLNTQTQ